jgi:hypothetical protein
MTADELVPALAASSASDAFRTDVAAYANRLPSPRLTSSPQCPRVKVLRAIRQLLHAEPTLVVDAAHVQAVSGCADFVGTLEVTDDAGDRHDFAFEWNCEWKARQLGYVDGFGFPDQIRAAQEFDWQCFARWERVATPVTAGS